MARSLVEIAAELTVTRMQVQGKEGATSLTDFASDIGSVYNALQVIKQAEEKGILINEYQPNDASVPQPAPAHELLRRTPMDSIKTDFIICLECGARMKQLTSKHLAGHGLTIREYKRKYGIPLKQALSAKMLSRARSKAAKKRGLPENLLKYQDGERAKKLAAAE